MMTCGLPRNHGCGRCDTCRNPDGSYSSTPGERWVFGLVAWACWALVSITVGAVASLVTDLNLWAIAGCTLVSPLVALILIIGLGPM